MELQSNKIKLELRSNPTFALAAFAKLIMMNHLNLNLITFKSNAKRFSTINGSKLELATNLFPLSHLNKHGRSTDSLSSNSFAKKFVNTSIDI